jgi:phosphate transport system permease protein
MIIEMMAAIPSVVYGLWAATVLRFWVLDLANAVGAESIGGYSVLSGGLILAVMLLPTVVAVSDDAMQAVPRSYREASLALGASTSETARRVVFGAALPGIGAAVVLSLGRAIGETMAVLMVSGNAYRVPMTLFDPAWVMTSVIAQHLGTAYVEPLWRSALFAIGFVLLIMSILFTAVAKLIIRWGLRTRGMQ